MKTSQSDTSSKKNKQSTSSLKTPAVSALRLPSDKHKQRKVEFGSIAATVVWRVEMAEMSASAIKVRIGDTEMRRYHFH